MYLLNNGIMQQVKLLFSKSFRSKIGRKLVPIVNRRHHGKTFVDRLWHSIFFPLTHPIARGIASQWSPYSRLFLVSDFPLWVLSREMQEIGKIAKQLGIQVTSERWLKYGTKQTVFYASQFAMLSHDWKTSSHRIAIAYFHGHPNTPDMPEFSQCFNRVRQFHNRISRIQVSYSEMHNLILSTEIDPAKVFRIPIGINLAYFHQQTQKSRRKIRAEYGIPQSAVVVGSFQKDGVGWGEGLEPKLIKGPDIFLKAIELLKLRIPELHVVLSGPARGYIKTGLERLNVPYHHFYLDSYPEIGRLFHALDVYIVASRQEGGPKAVLESMACGVPLVTTRVGQAMDLVQHGQNGWMVDVEDAEGLAYWTEYVLTQRSVLDAVLPKGRQTAEANSYELQIPLWQKFFNGFVKIPASG